ncbi:pyruvate carboxylase subunit B [Pseudoflavonifractor sp. MSJ-37]|uniref:pyruvate carboxylase subunit B n=1 Tax=Pseudoflavonifractor sp. MSJ-37 TaxID=2841531 RepID=UPI001C117DEA|nr:pyruvate carboxylase subunit B [Pseudoflavonifractor sp. MSJ-37]MBU5436031.1 pyruvate carboxylase subunit B [Pseudoflavonifractor sp. MSJ-37]
MSPFAITETVLRDAQQSLMATRMATSDFKDILETMDKAGYRSVECWGGATFDACLRYLHEDPWERLRAIRAHMPHTKLQMLLRGQNLLGYHHYSDDTVRRFTAASVENGVDIVRIFDALNDLRNIRTAVEACLSAGGEAQGTVCYTLSPIHDQAMYVALGKEIQAMGCQSLCIKDMAGIMSPRECYDLVSALKDAVDLPVYVHTHATTGLAYMTYLKAAEAGAAGIDCATSCFSGGTSQPSTASMVYALGQMGFDCGVDPAVLKQVDDFFVPVQKKFAENGVFDPYVLSTKTDALVYQVPGGMLSNLVSQLKAQNAIDKLDQVLAEIPKVRKDLGYPPLVTPLSQMVGVQATVNVLLGERYKSIGKEIQAYIRGEYGTAPGPIDPKLQRRVLGDQSPIRGRYAEGLAPEFPEAQAKLGGDARSDLDVLSYIAFPQQAEQFFTDRAMKEALVASYTIREVE